MPVRAGFFRERYAGLLRQLGHQRWFAWVGRQVTPVDRWLRRRTRGRWSLSGDNTTPALLLTTTGRRSGLPRVQPLLYARDGDGFVVVGSNWGQAGHPAWSANLIADPAAVVEVDGERTAVRATLCTGPDRDRLWALLTQVWPAYATYDRRAGRELRVFRLAPYAREVAVALREITAENRDAVLALRVAAGQETFVGSVADALADAEEYPQANAWCRAVYPAGSATGTAPVGFVMVSWNVVPQPPDIIGPWFLWKLLIDRDHQGRGYGADVVRQVAAIVRAEGATELLTSYVSAEVRPDLRGPAGFYERLGFLPTGDVDAEGETIVRLPLV